MNKHEAADDVDVARCRSDEDADTSTTEKGQTNSTNDTGIKIISQSTVSSNSQNHTTAVGFVEINRPVFNVESYSSRLGNKSKKISLKRKLIQKTKENFCVCTLSCWLTAFFNFIPIVKWLPKYSIKENFIADVLSGMTLGLMSIPQGMAYARLAGMPPIYGLYTNLVPTAIYVIFGTSRHAAIDRRLDGGYFHETILKVNVIPFLDGPENVLVVGKAVFVHNKASCIRTNSMQQLLKENDVWLGNSPDLNLRTATVMSLMMGAIRYKHLSCEDCWRSHNFSTNGTHFFTESVNGVTPIELGTSTAFLVGIMLLAMGFMRLDFVTAYLSDQIVCGYTAGAAVHIFTAQLDSIFGVHIDKIPGIGKIIVDYIHLFGQMKRTNFATLIISTVALSILIVLKLFINPRVRKYIKIPLPGELFVVIFGTLVSYLMNVKERYGVKIVQHIPAKFPTIVPPRFDIMESLSLECFVLAVLTYCQAVSQAKLYAKLHSYTIDPRQEFFAVGLTNLMGSFFQCFNAGMSVSRSIVYERSGAKSQIAGLIGTSIVIVTILFVAPYLESLPQGILAAIIIAACVDLLRQLKELKILWRISKYDFSIYLSTFASVVILDVTYGLLFSVVFACFTVVIRLQRQHVVTVGQIPGTDFFAETERYSTVKGMPNVIIVQFHAPIYYANVDKFKSTIFKTCNIVTDERKLSKISTKSEVKIEESMSPNRDLIINCSSVLYVDLMGINALKQAYMELEKNKITVFITNLNGSVLKMLEKTDFFKFVNKDNIFVTVHDAIIYSNRLRNLRKESEIDIELELKL